MNTIEFNQRLSAVKELTNIFKIERMVYLGVTLVALVMLLGSALSLIFKGKVGIPELGLLFGSSGLITYSAGRLLYMWNEAMNLLKSPEKTEEKAENKTEEKTEDKN